jgi:hypothetical protein
MSTEGGGAAGADGVGDKASEWQVRAASLGIALSAVATGEIPETRQGIITMKKIVQDHVGSYAPPRARSGVNRDQLTVTAFATYIKRIADMKSTPPHLLQGIRAGVGACEAMLETGHTPSLTMPHAETTFEDDGASMFPTASFGVAKKSGRRTKEDFESILELVGSWEVGAGLHRAALRAVPCTTHSCCQWSDGAATQGHSSHTVVANTDFCTF